MVCLDGATVVNHKMVDIWRLNRAQEGIMHGDESGMGQHSPRGGLSPVSLPCSLAADLAEFSQTNHIIQATVALDIENGRDAILASDDLDNRNFPVLHVLALVDSSLVITI